MTGLLQFVISEMPFSVPGSLDEESYVNVVAYLLSMNGMPAGSIPLAPGATGVISPTER